MQTADLSFPVLAPTAFLKTMATAAMRTSNAKTRTVDNSGAVGVGIGAVTEFLFYCHVKLTNV